MPESAKYDTLLSVLKYCATALPKCISSSEESLDTLLVTQFHKIGHK